MSYNASIPLVTDFLANSNNQIRSNYQSINAAFSRNHVALPNKQNEGMHNFLTFRLQTGDPTTTATQIALYTKVVNSIPELFFRPSNDQTPIQLTYPSLSVGLQSTNPDVFLPQQYSFMAGPFVIYMGTILINDGDVITLLPATTLVYVSVIQKDAAAAGKQNAAATNVAANQFTVRIPFNTQPQTVCYTAIGV
jgi:hypothetical protein